MQSVAEVNGVRVFSDKEVDSVVNGRVTFSDGSWCDVETRNVVNKGPGFITIGTPPEGEEPQIITSGPQRFSARNLDLRDLYSDVSVDVHTGPDIEVSVTGTPSQVESVSCEVQNDTLFIRASRRQTASVGSINVRARKGPIGRTGGRLTSMLRDITSAITDTVITFGRRATVTIRVPEGTGITLSDISGSTEIGDTRGPLKATLSGFDDLKAGIVGDTELTVDSSGGASIRAVNGSLKARARGFGDIEVSGGEISDLDVSVTSSGEVDIDATANGATLETSGFGNITVRRVNGPLIARSSSSGEIEVKGGDMPHVDAEATGFGDIDIRGTANTAELTSTSSGSITLSRVKTPPLKRCRGFGDIEVGRVG